MNRSQKHDGGFKPAGPLEGRADGGSQPPNHPISSSYVRADRGAVAIGGNVSSSLIQTFVLPIADGKIPPEIQDLLKQNKGKNIPYSRNANFTGRIGLLDELRADLQSARIKALTGLGGIGKTQLALEYSYQYQNDYDIVWWFRSELTTTILDDYALMAERLKLPGWETGDVNLMAEVARTFLENQTRWLLVFDNAQGPDDLRTFLPRGGGGHVILTSRNPSWGNLARPIEVPEFERSESVGFLLRRTGQDDGEAADKLAYELGDLPLALEQAGAYMETTAKPLTEYLAAFKKRKLDVLAKGKPSDYPATVATTWDLSFEAVQKENPAGSELLRLFSFMAPDDIPLDLLVKGSGHPPDILACMLQDEDGRDAVLAKLRRYSLIIRSGDMISVHRLVQALTRDRLSDDERKRWANAAVLLVNDAFPFDSYDVRAWSECALLLPHALAVTDHAYELGAAPEALGRLLNQAGVYLWSRAKLREAGKLHVRAIKIDVAAYGPDHPNVAIGLCNLGLVMNEMGYFEEAKENFERALKIDGAAYGPDHPSVAIGLSNLGLVMNDMGYFEEAKEHLERALEIDEKVYGPDKPNVAGDLNNLGLVLHNLGDQQGAKTHFERALKIDEKVYGPDHPNVAIRVHNLGSFLKAMGDLRGAKTHFERALNIFQDNLGENHPSTVTVRKNLVSLELYSAVVRYMANPS